MYIYKHTHIYECKCIVLNLIHTIRALHGEQKREDIIYLSNMSMLNTYIGNEICIH